MQSVFSKRPHFREKDRAIALLCALKSVFSKITHVAEKPKGIVDKMGIALLCYFEKNRPVQRYAFVIKKKGYSVAFSRK